jgi:Ca2+-binding RTX toxin-like protein
MSIYETRMRGFQSAGVIRLEWFISKRSPLVSRALVLIAVLAGLVAVPAAFAQTFNGTTGNDVLTGTDHRDFIFGRAGDDTLSGAGGSDLVFGGRGIDTVSGDDGRDFLWGGRGADSLDGGDGHDWVYAGRGTDVLEGGLGDDHLFAGADDGNVDTVDCGAGFDVALIRTGDVAIDCERVRTFSAVRPRGSFIRGDASDNVLAGTENRDFIWGKGGNDTISGGGASDFLFGGLGNDTVSGEGSGDFVWGGPGDDLLAGNEGRDWVWGGWGADTISGDGGNDHLFAAADDGAVDTLDCGEDADDNDVAFVRTGDTTLNCERVRVVS